MVKNLLKGRINKVSGTTKSKMILMESKSMQNAYDRFLRTLCNKTRLVIIQSLINKPKNVSNLTKEFKIHQTSVSHSLKRLLDCGFVFVEKKGKERVYSVNKKTIGPLMKLIEEHINNYCIKGSCCKNEWRKRK